jgi:hypothetical protein
MRTNGTMETREMKTIVALPALAGLAAALVASPALAIAGLLLVSAIFAARALIAWPGEFDLDRLAPSADARAAP